MNDLNIGDRLGCYQLLRKLGEGGMGMVFEAVHKEIERHVAIKVLRPEITQNRQALMRLFNEARAVNLIDHPGTVQIHDCVCSADGETAYLVMEYLHGMTLGARLVESGGSLSEQATLRIARQTADLLVSAHGKGVVHRDLKPENIMLVPDPAAVGGERVKVLDFGIAKLSKTGTARTGTNMIMGTPGYMSPEQCRGAGRVDGKSDVYSLGIMLFQMLSGFLPFNGAAMGEFLYQHLLVPPPEILSVAPQVTRSTANLVMSLLSKDKDQRPAMADVVIALAEAERALDGGPASAATSHNPAESQRTFLLPQVRVGVPMHNQTPPSERNQARLPLTAFLRRRWLQGLLFSCATCVLGIPLLAGLSLSSSPSKASSIQNRSVAGSGTHDPKSIPVDLLHNAPATLQVSSTTRSATLSPQSLVDGDLQTAWNSRPGDLVGATVTFTVPDYARVHTLQLTAGFTKVSDKGDLFTMNHRIREVTLFRNGALLGHFKLDPENRGLQEIPVNQPGGRFELQIEDVVAGTRRSWREVCISELVVLGWLPSEHPPVQQEPTVGIVGE